MRVACSSLRELGSLAVVSFGGTLPFEFGGRSWDLSEANFSKLDELVHDFCKKLRALLCIEVGFQVHLSLDLAHCSGTPAAEKVCTCHTIDTAESRKRTHS